MSTCSPCMSGRHYECYFPQDRDCVCECTRPLFEGRSEVYNCDAKLGGTFQLTYHSALREMHCQMELAMRRLRSGDMEESDTHFDIARDWAAFATALKPDNQIRVSVE